MYNPVLGTFNQRDPIQADNNFYRYVHNNPTNTTDPEGLADCTITIYGGHNFNCLQRIEDDYPNGIPPTDRVTGVGCGVPSPGGGSTSLPGCICKKYPENSIPIPGAPTNPIQGVRPFQACAGMKKALAAARTAAHKMSRDEPINPSSKCPPPHCATVSIIVKCDSAMNDLFDSGTWHTPDGRTVTIPKQYWEDCKGLCGSFEVTGRGTTM